MKKKYKFTILVLVGFLLNSSGANDSFASPPMVNSSGTNNLSASIPNGCASYSMRKGTDGKWICVIVDNNGNSSEHPTGFSGDEVAQGFCKGLCWAYNNPQKNIPDIIIPDIM